MEGEGVEDVTRGLVLAGDQGLALEADHGVAAPIGEPGISGDDRARLVAFGSKTGFVPGARVGRDDELVGGEDELGGRPARERRERLGV